MTKYVELVIVADNREVRTVWNFLVDLKKNNNNNNHHHREKKMFSKLLHALINLIFYEALRALWTTHGEKWLPDLTRYKTLKMYLLLQNISKGCRKKILARTIELP